ncbi:hypothetical protein DBY21_09765 [Candidatus Gastranaerophilales bacterium]|nr:MAG: hypothetical protein DBY21_09765 [Candidatus Gastranaerophilales bacterium]
MFSEYLTLSNLYMITGFLISMYSCVSNDVIQTLGTYLTTSKKMPTWLIWAFTSAVLIITITTGWIVNNGDMAFGRLERIPFPETFTLVHVLPPIILLFLTRYGIPVSTTFLILSIFSASDISVIGMILSKSIIGYFLALVVSIIIYTIIARPLERVFYYTADKKISKWWIAAKWASTAFLWSQWLMQDAANLFVYLPRKTSFSTLLFVLIAFSAFLWMVADKRGGEVQKIVKMKTNVQDPRSATIIDLIYAFLLLYFIQLNNIPMSTTWVFIGLLAGREIALYNRLRFESPKKMYKHILKDLTKVTFGLVVSIVVVVILIKFDLVKEFFMSHFM